MLPVDLSSYDYKFNKTLNEDVQLVSDEYGKYDLNMSNGDYINITGLNSLHNAIIIAILTRIGELTDNPTYENFGCRVHDLIKDNKTKLLLFKLETSLTETLNNIRRIKTVNYLNITENDAHSFDVAFDVTSINDETVKGKVAI
mgnify:CR=1 FL=1